MKQSPSQLIPTVSAEDQFVKMLEKVADQFKEIRDDRRNGEVTPARAAFIDCKLEQIIGYLCSARAMIVIAGGKFPCVINGVRYTPSSRCIDNTNPAFTNGGNGGAS